MRARIRAGDPQAFAELFDEYARILYNHAFRLTADWAAAEDVVSATFMEAWRGHQRVDADGGTLRPWLLGIATNLVRAQSRSNRRFKAAALAAAQAETAVADHADEVAGRIDDRRRLAATATALA
ncbi:RNA polymerase sigma factor, partial [Streptomyces sp. NPDC005149]